MSSVADNQSVETNLINTELNAALERWRYSPSSVILHHGKSCCTIAREWLFRTDHSQLNGQHRLTGPRWLRKKYDWGPSQWPMTWCQALEQDSLDCGALTALTREIFVTRDVICHSVQLVQQYSEATTSHWSTKWADHPASTHWIHGALIYHEACGVEVGTDEIRIWDPSAGWWANPKQFGGFGSIVALRITTNNGHLGLMRWGEQQIGSEWQIIEHAYDSRRNGDSRTTDTLTRDNAFPTVQMTPDLRSMRENRH
jgi:hypothetical protein